MRHDPGGALWKSAVVVGVVVLALIGTVSVAGYAMRTAFDRHATGNACETIVSVSILRGDSAHPVWEDVPCAHLVLNRLTSR